MSIKPSKLLLSAHPIELLFDLLRSDAHIAVNKALMFAIGVDEAIVFSELLSRQAYFADRDELDEEGYFYNTVDNLRAGTSLTDYQQRMAITTLKKIGLIDVKISGIPAKRFFKVSGDHILLVNLLAQGKFEAEKARKSTKITSSQKTKELELKKLQTNKNKNKGNGPPGPDYDPDQPHNMPDWCGYEAHYLLRASEKRKARRTKKGNGNGQVTS